jgi:hypothetical protein
MLNKKIVAAAVAAAFTQSAVAAVDIDEAVAPQKVTYASELVTAVGGFLDVTNGGNALDITVEAGFSIGAGTSKYARYDFSGAKFNVDATGTLDVGGVIADLSAGGQIGDDYVIFEVAATSDVAATDDLLLAASQYTIEASGTSQVCYSLYETALEAVNADTSQSLKTACQDFAELGSAYTGTFATGADATSTVASTFTKFDGAAGAATTATVGTIDATDAGGILVPNVLDATSTPVTALALIDATLTVPGSQDVQFDGDFSFGVWTVETAPACDGTGAVTIAPDVSGTFGTLAALPTATLVGNPWYVCVNVDGTETINKSSYSVTLVDSALSNDLGRIKYDTTSIEVPYLTTFADYNQRIYLINKGLVDAEYSMTWITEAGTDAEDGFKATGGVPAESMIAIKATDAVTLTGDTTRTAAIIEVEGVDANIQAATQSVNLSTGGTDTVVLNANSITSPN